MKHFTFKRALLKVCFMSTFGISQVQKHVWYLYEQEIDFATATPTVTAIDPQFGAGPSDFTGNGIHDADGEKVLSVAGGLIRSKYGDLGVLANYEAADADRVSIIPKPGSTCNYYIVYTTYSPVQAPDLLCGMEAYYNTYYSEVDMSANGGLGQIVSNGNALSQCTFFNSSSCSFAVSKELINGNRYLYFFGANDFLPGSATPRISKYLVSPTGITFVNNILTGSFLSTTTAVETELSHDGTMLALADNSGNKAYILHLNPVSGNLVPSAGNNGDGTSDFTIPTTTNNLTGIEFSANGNNLFVGSRNDGIFQIDILNDLVGSLPLANSALYGNSQLELAYEPTGDYKIYAVHQNGTQLGRIIDPNLPGPTFQDAFLSGISVYSGGYQSYLADIYDLKVLPSQIDGEDYVAKFASATGECCASLEGFNTFTFTAPVSASWQPALNPFGNIPVVTIGEELRIPTGKTIHIQNMTFKFNEGAKLVIEPGARLILTNSVLTSMDCDRLMWSGVELQGNASLDQSPTSQQGFLLMQSNSEISNAHNGISVYGRDGLDNIDWSKTGGIVQASNSVFRNNIRDVEYLSYFHQITGYYRNCEFITDAAINNGAFPYAHVTMYRVKGIGFYGCDFKNTTTGLYGDQNRGKGIKSVDAKYKVTYRCTAVLPVTTPCPDVNKDGCVFENLYFGIEATAALPDYTIDVRYNDFINNTRAAYLSGLDFAYFVNNHLEVATPFSYSYGLYLNNCTGYTVENNDLSTIYGSATYGVVVVNSNDGGISSDVNEIYRNTFDGFDYAATAGLANVK
ncbi:MAG: hypothetical protein IPO32_18495, partial [Crocinitomicaceae bacterium]|nr:hypothetical protein [Crocinitomicaceae bacterium]